MATTVKIKVDRTAANRIGLQTARRKVTDTTRRVFNRVTVSTPVRTGNLRSQNRMEVRSRGLRVTGTVSNHANYAAAVHKGTPPHVIRPRSKKALRFVVDGQVVFAAKVNHPGTRGRPWLRQALVEIAVPEGYRIT